MASLREVKDRIASVRSTLKITSAMKLVASSKLRKAQRAIEALRPYEATLNDILSAAGGEPPRDAYEFPVSCGDSVNGLLGAAESEHRTVILAFASNSSMCGAFNANVVKKALEVIGECGDAVEVWAFGRKMAEGLRKGGCPAARDLSQIVTHPSFDEVAILASELRELYATGEISRVLLVYNHFVSAGKQEVVVEPYLISAASSVISSERSESRNLNESSDFIIEPSRTELVRTLLPQILNLKLYAALLDSVASEHAARMIAMQAATDNGETLLGELTLEYNKGRQQKITSEILDLVSGEAS